MLKYLLGFFIIMLISLQLSAGVPDTLWTKHYNVSWDQFDSNGNQMNQFGRAYDDIGHCVREISNGGFIITGLCNDGCGFLIKTDSLGNEIWANAYGSYPRWMDEARSVIETPDGGFMFVGWGEIDKESKDVAIMKVDSTGTLLWHKHFGGSERDRGYSIEETYDGNYIIAGYTRSGDYDVYLLKVNPSGNLIWSKTFGGSDDDKAFYIKQTSDSGFILTGYTESYGGSDEDVYVIKTDRNGNLEWQDWFGFSSKDSANCIQQTSDGGYIVTGFTNNNLGDLFLLKLNSNGNQTWFKQFGDSRRQEGTSVRQTSDNGYIITGYTQANYEHEVWIIKTDTIGNMIWDRTYSDTAAGTRARGFSIEITDDDGYIVSGCGREDGNYVYLLKMSTDNHSYPAQIEAEPDSIDFWNVHIGDTRVDTFRIRNLGLDPLNVSSVNITGINSSQFTHNSSTSFTVDPQSYHNIEVIYHPNEMAYHLAYLEIISNDTINPTYSLPMNGSGYPDPYCFWDFETGGFEGWTHNNSDGWYVDWGNGWNNYPYYDNHVVDIYSTENDDATDTLKSPIVQNNNYTIFKWGMRYNSKNDPGDTIDVLKILVREKIGNTWSSWNVEKVYYSDISASFDSINISSYLNSDNIQLAFYFGDYHIIGQFNAGGASVDNILLISVPLNAVEENLNSEIPSIFSSKIISSNPGFGQIKIQYSLPNTGNVIFTIYDVVGRIIYSDIQTNVNRGINNYSWDCIDNLGNQISSGSYFYQIEADNQITRGKSVVTR